MKRIVIAAAMGVCVVSLSGDSAASADTLVLRDGTRIEGTVVGVVEQTITFRRADGSSRPYPTSQVEALEFPPAERGYPRAVSGRSLVVPAGTELFVRTVESIDSRSAGVDQHFSALVEEEVANGSGRVIVPGGLERPADHQAPVVGRPDRQPRDGARRPVDRRGRAEIQGQHDGPDARGRPRHRQEQAHGPGDRGGRRARHHHRRDRGRRQGRGDWRAGRCGSRRGRPGAHGGRDVRVPAETVLSFRLDRSVTLQPEQ